MPKPKLSAAKIQRAAQQEQEEQSTAVLRQKLAQKSARNHDLERELADVHGRLQLLERLEGINCNAPGWMAKPKKKGELHHATPTAILSDSHFDEVVNPDEVRGINAYNREIAQERLRRHFDGIIKVTRDYFAGLKYDGFALMMAGDNFSGTIHEELIETNVDTLYGSMDFWTEPVMQFIGGLVEEFGRLHIAAVAGNHGRRTHKPRAKFRARDNADWFFCKSLARLTALMHGDRVTWDIPDAAETTVRIYNTNYLLTHGDRFKGGSGISGMMSPLMLGLHRTAIRELAMAQIMEQKAKGLFDWMVMGHFHHFFHGMGLIVNNTSKGYDEYAMLQGFRPTRPSQALWMTTPENGATFPTEIFVDH